MFQWKCIAFLFFPRGDGFRSQPILQNGVLLPLENGVQINSIPLETYGTCDFPWGGDISLCMANN